jgi:hypothetical protein
MKKLEALKGFSVILFCSNYFYTGKVVYVDDTVVSIKGAKMIFDTGEFKNGTKFKDAEKLYADEWNINLASIESFGCLEEDKMIGDKLLK